MAFQSGTLRDAGYSLSIADDRPRRIGRLISRASVSDFTAINREGHKSNAVSGNLSAPNLPSLAGNVGTVKEPEKLPESALSNGKLNGAVETEDGPRTSGTKGKEVVDDSSLFRDYHPSQGWKWMPHHLSQDNLWRKIREEAKEDADTEPALASVLHSTVLVHRSLEKTMAFILANKLASTTLLGTHLMRLVQDAYEQEPDIIDALCADIQAVFDRDPACDKYTQCMLYFKGFQAIQSHRIANWLWNSGRKSLALALQSRISEVFHVDFHPGARFGRGVMIDHATGVVVGETAVIGDNVSMLHHVTLGGSGTGKGKRHPTIGHGALLGAGAIVLGPITVGNGTKVGAGTVVVSDLPSHAVAVGVPAKIIKRDKTCEPCINMDQCSDFIYDFQI